jgi:hypothetical protein
MRKFGQIRVTECGKKRQDSPDPMDVKFLRTDLFCVSTVGDVNIVRSHCVLTLSAFGGIGTWMGLLHLCLIKARLINHSRNPAL